MFLIFLIIGLFFLFITYVAAPIESRIKGKFVSGVPGIGGSFVAFAFLTTPYKWLAVLGLADWKILWLFFKVIPDAILSQKEIKNRPFPPKINNELIIMHTKYKKKYAEILEPDKNYEHVSHVLDICYYAVSKCDTDYALLSLDVNYKILKKEIFHTIEKCKDSVGKNVEWIYIHQTY